MANANQVFQSIGDGLANGARWLLSWVPGGNPGGTYTTIQDDVAAGENVYGPPSQVIDAVNAVRDIKDLTKNENLSVILLFLAGLIFINIIFRR